MNIQFKKYTSYQRYFIVGNTIIETKINKKKKLTSQIKLTFPRSSGKSELLTLNILNFIKSNLN